MTLSSWKEREKNQRRDYIVDAAEKLFFEHDYNNVSMDDIAQILGLGKSTLYLYFKNKEALFYAVALRGMRILNAMHLQCWNMEGTGIDKLHATTKGYFEFTIENQEYFLILCYIASNPSSSKDNPYVKEFTELALTNIQTISKILEEGHIEGKIRGDLNPVEMAVFLSIIANSIMNMDPVWKVTLARTGTSEDQIWEHYLRFITPAVETQHELNLD
jgi:TetR/AcrR family transcriptional regulator